jgi:aminopeptidase
MLPRVTTGGLLSLRILLPLQTTPTSYYPIRRFSNMESNNEGGDQVELIGRGMVVGCYETSQGVELTEAASQLDEVSGGKLRHLLEISGKQLKKGDSRLFYDLTNDLTHVAIVTIGKKEQDEGQEDMDMHKHNVRCAAAAGVKMLEQAKVRDIMLEDFSDAQSCAEGSQLALFAYDDMKGKGKKDRPKANVDLWDGATDEAKRGWSRGCVLADAQNFARWLMETPSNHMTPGAFVDSVIKRLAQLPADTKNQMEINPRQLSWIQEQKMGSFLSVTRGSDESPWLLEIKYNGGPSNQPPVALVGKGITFDSGGISIKPSAGMSQMKADMGGAACVAGTTVAIATLGIPINLVSLMPLCENMPSGKATKPGDVVTAMDGTTIEVDNTDAEGRLILADALCYAHTFKPSAIIDMATLTGAIGVALGSGAAGTYSTSNSMWEQLHQAGRVTGDRLWRMPLYEQYSKQMESKVADLNNAGCNGRSAGSCTAAAFLKSFVEVNQWTHIDIAGVMDNQGISSLPYLGKGMSGRPTRTIIEYLQQLTASS